MKALVRFREARLRPAAAVCGIILALGCGAGSAAGKSDALKGAITSGGGAGSSAVVTVDVWPQGKMPGKATAAAETEKRAKGSDVRLITNISRPTLTVFPAASAKGRAPAMVICPGGGYSVLAIDLEGTEIARWLNTLGITGVVLKYRVPRNREGALQDVQRALSVARANAAAWDIDPKRLGIIGFSAGGNLAAKASTRLDERSYAPIDAIDKESCRPDCAVLVYPAYLDEHGHLTPEVNVHAGMPPTLIVHNEDDRRFVSGSKLYNAALDAAQVPHEFLLYPTGGHGYGLHCKKAAGAWPEGARKWLEKMGMR